MKKKWKTAGGALALLLCVCGGTAAVSAQEAEAVISQGVFIGDKDVSGMTPEEAEAYVKDEVEKLGSSAITLQMGDSVITKSWNELGLQWKNPELIEEVSQLGQTGNIVRRYKEQKDLQNQSAQYEIEYELDEDAEKAFVESCAQFNSEPVEGTCYVGEDGGLHVEGGTDGLTLDAEATLASLQEHLDKYEAGDVTIEATVDRVSPVLTAELLEQMDDVLGSATTDYSASSAARAKNVENGVAKINGTLLMPGESFSVTSAVIPFTAENGYELAPSYEAGQVVDSYGGGICQVSTTLYNALLKAEVQIDARSNHTMIVNYVDPSKDAAIAEGVMDLAFTNTLEYPIFISGSAYYGTLNFTIFGVDTRPSNRSIEFVSETTGQTDPAQNIKLVAKTDQNVGYLMQVQSPHQGLSAALWKNIYYDGVLSETIQVNSSNYQASPAIYEVGVLTDNQALASALYTAIGQNNLSQVQSIMANGVQQQSETQQSETQQSETQPQTEAPQTNAPQTDAPQTDAPLTDPPEVWDDGGVTVIE